MVMNANSHISSSHLKNTDKAGDRHSTNQNKKQKL